MWSRFSPAGGGIFDLYEDNGNDKVRQEVCPYIFCSKHVGNRLEVTIGKSEGGYPGMPAERAFKVKVVGSAIPQSVTVNGKTVKIMYMTETLYLF